MIANTIVKAASRHLHSRDNAHPGAMVAAHGVAVERTGLRVDQYRRHIAEMQRAGRACEGAILVLTRLEHLLLVLQQRRRMHAFVLEVEGGQPG